MDADPLVGDRDATMQVMGFKQLKTQEAMV
jgi:hypothetical protein